MIWWSIVGPTTSPPCSGEFDGPLISQPVFGSLTRKSTKNSAASFMHRVGPVARGTGGRR